MSSADTFKYASASAVHGNLAYDFTRTAPEPRYIPDYEPEYEPQTRPSELPKTEEQERVKLHSREKSCQRVSLFGILGIGVAAALLVLVLLAYVRITQISDSMTDLRSELTQLEANEARLLVEHESVFNLNEIENYAINVLGMVKADSTQISYLDASEGDRAEILREDGHGGISGLWRSVTSFLSSVQESFR